MTQDMIKTIRTIKMMNNGKSAQREPSLLCTLSFTVQPGETISTNIGVAGVYVVRADGARIQKKFAIR